MKSKKAKTLIKDNTERIEINSETGETERYVTPHYAYRAIKLAESEMIDRAVEAFKKSCTSLSIASDYCDMRDELFNGKCDECSRYQLFIQKLTE